MPKQVNHDIRRQEISDALLQLAAKNGLHSVSMRTVAAEAGVSLRQIQFYFGDKATLMLSALNRLEQRSHQRWEKRINRLPKTTSTRTYLEGFLKEALPTDKESRLFQMVWTSYAVLSMTDKELGQKPFTDGPTQLKEQIRGIFEEGKSCGDLSKRIDAEKEATRLLALNHGLGMGVLTGQQTVKQAITILNYHLDSVFQVPL